MSITEKLISDIKGIVNQISALGNEYANELSRHKQKISDLNESLNSNKDKRKTDANKRINSYKTSLQSFEQGIKYQRNDVQNLEAQLNGYYQKSKVNLPLATAIKFNEKEAKALLNRISETGFWSWLKKILALGKYKTNSAMATDLYAQIANAYMYLDSCVIKEREKCSRNIQAETNAMSKDISVYENQFNAAVVNENNASNSKLKTIEQRKQAIIAHKSIGELSTYILSEFSSLGGDDASWSKYLPSSSIPTDLLVGIICVPSGIAVPNQVQRDIFKKITCYNDKINCFVIPMTASTGKPFLLYSETDSGDVYQQAEIFRSFVLRQLRFMPPKSIKVSYIDPVNRGTTMGQLSHLFGDDASNVCIPFLDSQDISKEIKNLKSHVDKVCDILTKSGYSNVYAYNAGQNPDKIPFRTVVINDFPIGFDSQSLDDLQVLMNKATQCGISILISRKKNDKLENKALETVRKTDGIFIQHRSNSGKSDTINIGSLYGFKKYCNNIPNSFLMEINDCYNYKAPIINEYTKFFSCSKLPQYRSSIKELSIPFAVDRSGNMIDFVLNYKTLPYGFITGSIGSGKTTLLHTLITSAVIHYHPDELEMWLVDFKETEFAFYTHCCPHQLRYVAANESSEIAYSVMDEIVAELRRRKEAFKSANAVDFVEYRKNHCMPRLLIIVDEFHRMSQAASDSDSYKIVLENIVAEARSHGISLLFCDQMISSGLNGLTPKARKLFAVKIAMRNDADEIKQTLDIPTPNLTDDIKDIINQTSSGLEGSLIYKKESKNDKDASALSNKVDFIYCRAMYFEQKTIQEEFITASNGRIGYYDRPKVFFVNAKREKMDTTVISNYENYYPVLLNEGERYYIGSSLGLKPCFFFDLKNASAENILMIGNDDEKRISVIKSIVTCARHNNREVVFLISKASALFIQNKDFFKEGNGVKIFSTFPDICKYIGENSNRVNEIKENDEVVPIEQSKLTICIGLDDIFEKMENSTLSQERAWKVEKTPDDSKQIEQEKIVPKESKIKFNQKSTNESMNVDSERRDVLGGASTSQSSLLAKIESKKKAAESEEPTVKAISDSFSGGEASKISGYHATGDLANIISDGWKIGILTMVVLDNVSPYKKMDRALKMSEKFNHRIALRMSSDAASEFMTKTNVMKKLNDQDDQISAIYSNMGGREQCFRPYIF